MFGANLQVASHVEVKDPTGRLWTVHIVRHGDPRDPVVRSTSLYGAAVVFNRLRRLLRRDSTWDVEFMPGPLRDDRTESIVHANEQTEEEAIEAAVRLARQVKAGTVWQSHRDRAATRTNRRARAGSCE